MSQTISPAVQRAGSPQVAGSSGPGQRVSGRAGAWSASASTAIRHYLATSPGRLRVVSALAVLAAVLVALGGGAALRERSGALDEAKRSAEHLVLVQSVQTNLVQADADATNSFLAFGLEPRAQRVDYLEALGAASRDLAKAVDGGAAGRLGSANTALTRYTGYVASARANNLQGLPVGASYLQTARALLESDVLPQLEAGATADTAAIESAYSRAGRAALWLALVAILGLGALIWTQVYLARHSRRILNVPLAASTVGLLLAVFAATGAMAAAQAQANDVRAGDLAQARALSASRVAAFNAKSVESLTLISRGSGPTREPKWKGYMAAATSALPRDSADALQALNAYAAEHAKIRKLDDDGNWQQARKQAIAVGASSANAQFGTYAQATEKALQSRAAAADAGLGDAGNLLLPAGLLVVLVGLLAAYGAWWGISLRLDEYR